MSDAETFAATLRFVIKRTLTADQARTLAQADETTLSGYLCAPRLDADTQSISRATSLQILRAVLQERAETGDETYHTGRLILPKAVELPPDRTHAVALDLITQTVEGYSDPDLADFARRFEKNPVESLQSDWGANAVNPKLISDALEVITAEMRKRTGSDDTFSEAKR